MRDVSYTMAFLAGVFSFVSPCVLPLLPSYVSFITGLSFEDLTSARDRTKIFRLTVLNSIAFICGFSIIFIGLGASASAIGRLLFNYQTVLRIGGGILIIFFGIFVTEIIRLDFLMADKKFRMSGKPAGYIGTAFVGMAFAAGWTPCIGPMLGAILTYAGSHGSVSYGIRLLSVYSLGLGLPFLLSSMAVNSFLSYSKKLSKYLYAIKVASGIMLIIFGVLILTDRLSIISSIMPDIGIRF